MIELERKISKDIVHKSHDDDVLIYDARNMLPAWLTNAFVDTAVSDPIAIEAIRQAYRPCGERWVLRTLPERFSAEALQRHGLDSCLEELTTHYTQQDGEFVLTGLWVLESTEARLGCFGECTDLGVTERQQVYNALERVPGYPQQGMVYYTLFNDTSNYFFYRKHHEHVPGLMLIEVARQAMYAQFYEHSGYRRGEVSISIVDLLSCFPRYTESSYQVDVLVCDYDEQTQQRARKVDKRARFFQNGELVADIRLRGEAIKMPVFKRMRNININAAHWFRPLKGIRNEVLVRLDCGRHICGHLELLAMNGLQVRCMEKTIALDSLTHGHVYLYLENEGIVMLPVHALHEQSAVDGRSIKLHLADLDPTLRYKWREVLKQFAYFSHQETLGTDAMEDAIQKPAASPVLELSV
ncbi:AfsA-related hotdog domain-containing protein [Pseudomonas sp. OA65]|uniref:AfsA-related hotdog domain-containing protein n=1 Tax=Pseudomonas sp. OA65 TaxID=2818431 RepID=UPI001A9D7F74|nr:AfsA-related hotdog domain-containing protein [Pseudomonas sp. OA65]MBO1540735.1 A-factor biosynthesis protein [Pseudomonas sp. OA65]